MITKNPPMVTSAGSPGMVTMNTGDVQAALFNIHSMSELSVENKKKKSAVHDYIKEPFNVPTPPEKVKKRPDGFDYVETSWMNHIFKANSPLYSHELLYVNESLGWIDIIVRLTDRITGNSELGGGSARIQVRRGVENPGFGDVIDKGNNLKAALSNAIKNAESRFGHAADIYGKREDAPSDDDRARKEVIFTELKSISLTKANIFKTQWDQLGTDYTEYLDKWEEYVKKVKTADNNFDNKTKEG